MSAATVTPPAGPDDDVVVSIVVLAWNNLHHTRGFVESVRANTDVPYELIVVDNGSEPDAADYARSAADVPIMNEENRGFSPGMNQGMEVARGRFIAFCNNDTVLPPRWASLLVETAEAHPRAGIVVPAVTNAGTDRTVRSEPGTDVEVLPPWSGPPPAIIFFMPADVVRGIDGWGEEYLVASGEDVDIGFKVWCNDLDIVYDQRVLVDHVGKASASKLDDWQARWAENRRLFLEKWSGDTEIPRFERCDPDTFARNRAIAASVAEWMAKYFKARDKVQALEPALLKARDQVRALQDELAASRAGADRLRRDLDAARAAASPAPARPAPAAPAKVASPPRRPAPTTGERVRAEVERNLRRARRRMPPALKGPARAALDALPAGMGDRVRRASRERPRR